MKKNLKFLVAVLAVGALTSCTDELMESQNRVVKDGDLVGFLQSPTEDVTRVAYEPAGNQYVWADGDAIRVYTVDQLNYSSYLLSGGEGTQEGIFTLDGNDNVSSSTSKKYAVTEPEGSNTIYGISAINIDGKAEAQLTATVLPRYDWDDTVEMEDGSEIEAYRLPTPFWGEVTKMQGNNINVNFKALTGFIKLDLRRLPIGTQAIVLISHEDYYTVAAKGETGAVLHAGGANEPLAGTMNAILTGDAALGADTRLSASDTLRIDFDKVEQLAGEDKILYIPVAAQHYDKLDLLAVTTDNRAPYTWTEAEVIASWSDEVFSVGKTKGVYLDAEYEIDSNDPEVIAKEIVRRMDGNHDVRVKLLQEVDGTKGPLYILNNGQEQGLKYTNVEITFTKKQTKDLQIIECPANITTGGIYTSAEFLPLEPTTATLASVSKDKKQTVKLNFELGKTAPLDIACPESDIILSSSVTATGLTRIVASRTNDISGYEKAPYNHKKAAITLKGGASWGTIQVLSEKSAFFAYEDDTAINTLYMDSQQPGNIRLTDALAGLISFRATDISGTPAIWTSGAAAIKQITGDQNKIKVHAYWTGKSLTDKAVRLGWEGVEVKDDEKDNGVVYTAAQLQAIGLAYGLPSGSVAKPSGTPVLDYTVSKKVGFIWLGGEEFPWIGPQMGKMQNDISTPVIHSNRQLIAPNFTTGYDPYDLCEYDKDVTVDFNWVELRNMEMTIDDPYFDDPHKCCTSCGDFVVKVERDLGLIRSINTVKNATVKNVRLNDVELLCSDPKVNIPNVGSIVGRISADGDVTMNDNRVTNLQISIAGGNVGGHVGNILSEKGEAVVITKALAGQYKVTIGSQRDPATYYGWGKYNESKVSTIFVETIGENAGGLVGQILAPMAKVQIKDAEVGLNWIVSDGYKNVGGNNAGGLVGNLAYGAGAMGSAKTTPISGNAAQFTEVTGESNATILRGIVNADFIETYQAESASKRTDKSAWGYTGNNAGGFAGKAWAAQADAAPNFSLKDKQGLQMVADGTVNCQVLRAENRYAGGLIGYNKQAEASANDHVAATFISSETDAKHDTKVNIDLLTAEESVAGGLVGQQVMGDLVIGGGAVAKDNAVATVEVAIGELSTSFAGGGLVGQNLDDVDIDTWYRKDYTSNKTGYIKANVAAWENTWDAANFTGGYAGETPAALRMFCGSFDNLAGLVSEHFKVMNHTPVYDPKSGALVSGIETKGLIPNATKKALLFELWGDQIGYVGYADQTSFYLLEGTDYRQGDQEFNYRFPY